MSVPWYRHGLLDSRTISLKVHLHTLARHLIREYIEASQDIDYVSVRITEHYSWPINCPKVMMLEGFLIAKFIKMSSLYYLISPSQRLIHI